jgi:hypothetical protein
MLGHFVSSLAGSLLNLVTIIKYTKLEFNITGWFLLPALSGLYAGFMAYFTYNFCLVKLSFPTLTAIIISILFSAVIYTAILELANSRKFFQKAS